MLATEIENALEPSVSPIAAWHRWRYVALTSALRRTTYERDRVREPVSLLSRLGAHCTALSWRVLEADLRAGDNAPIAGTGHAIAWLESLVGPTEVARRLEAMLSDWLDSTPSPSPWIVHE